MGARFARLLGSQGKTFKARIHPEGVLGSASASSFANERSRLDDYCKTITGVLDDLPKSMGQYIVDAY
eukprot:10804460-Alexandrium_andersonii.AAC.1